MKRQLGIAILAISLFVAASLALQRESPATKAAIESSLQAQFSGVTGALTPSQTWDKTATAIHNGVIVGATGTTAATGEIGEHVRSVAASVSLSNGVAANITSISLTAGDWDVTGVGFIAGALTGTYCVISVSLVSATRGGVSGDTDVALPTMPTAISSVSLAVPSYRVSVTATTTVYLVAQAGFTAGTATAGGRLSARRAR